MCESRSAGSLGAMMTTDAGTDPGMAAPPPRTPSRVLRRSTTDRVGAGVAGGLGEYFNVDPVLFRVLFAVSAFFGGAGLLAYVVAWVAIPEAGTERAAIDGWIRGLRRRRIPFWLVAIAGAFLLWAVAFSWWEPRPFFPILVLVIVVSLLVTRRSRRARRIAAMSPTPMATAGQPTPQTQPFADSLEQPVWQPDADAPTAALPQGAPTPPQSPAWVGEARAWINEAGEASRERRRRAMPLRVGALTTLIVTITVLGIIDATSGIRIPVYFWVTGGIALVTILSGVVLRRTPWSLLPLLIISLIGTIAFGGTHASLHDGIGQKGWNPVDASALRSDYRLAFGQGVLDLRNVTLNSARTVEVTLGGGQIKILLPNTMNATVDANVRFGNVTVDGQQNTSDGDSRGIGVSQTVLPPIGSTGPAITVVVHVADGNITVQHG